LQRQSISKFFAIGLSFITFYYTDQCKFGWGPESTQCLSCATGSSLDENNQCVCSVGSYKEIGNCVACNAGCESCPPTEYYGKSKDCSNWVEEFQLKYNNPYPVCEAISTLRKEIYIIFIAINNKF
jgi:hypothetical protein